MAGRLGGGERVYQTVQVKGIPGTWGWNGINKIGFESASTDDGVSRY